MKKTKLNNFLGLVKNGILILQKTPPKNQNKKPPRWPSTYLLLGLSLLILYMKVQFCFSGSFYWNTETCYFVFGNKKQKKTKICYRTTEPLWKIIITNMQSYCWLKHISQKKLRMAVDKKRWNAIFFHPVVGTIFHFTGIHVWV